MPLLWPWLWCSFPRPPYCAPSWDCSSLCDSAPLQHFFDRVDIHFHCSVMSRWASTKPAVHGFRFQWLLDNGCGWIKAVSTKDVDTWMVIHLSCAKYGTSSSSSGYTARTFLQETSYHTCPSCYVWCSLCVSKPYFRGQGPKLFTDSLTPIPMIHSNINILYYCISPCSLSLSLSLSLSPRPSRCYCCV